MVEFTDDDVKRMGPGGRVMRARAEAGRELPRVEIMRGLARSKSVI